MKSDMQDDPFIFLSKEDMNLLKKSIENPHKATEELRKLLSDYEDVNETFEPERIKLREIEFE